MKYLENTGEFRWLEDHYDIPEGFHPTGSRWVGGWHNESDYDYFAYDTKAVEDFICQETNFRRIHEDTTNTYKYGDTFSEDKPLQSYRMDDINFIVYFEKWAYEEYVIANELARIRGSIGWVNKEERISFFERYTWKWKGEPAVLEVEIPKVLAEMKELCDERNAVCC